MIKSESHSITLAYCEIFALEQLMDARYTTLELFANGASYTAGHHGVTMYCTTSKQAEKVWAATLEATDDCDDDGSEDDNDCNCLQCCGS